MAMLSIRSWLDGVKAGWGARFGAAFEELGLEDTVDLSRATKEELDEVEQDLEKLGAKKLALRRIWEAALSVNTGLTTREEDVDDPGSTDNSAQAPPRRKSVLGTVLDRQSASQKSMIQREAPSAELPRPGALAVEEKPRVQPASPGTPSKPMGASSEDEMRHREPQSESGGTESFSRGSTRSSSPPAPSVSGVLSRPAAFKVAQSTTHEASLPASPKVRQSATHEASQMAEVSLPATAKPSLPATRDQWLSQRTIVTSSYSVDTTQPVKEEGEFEYFLSHKKSHSKDGMVPEQIAKSIHDSLHLLGHEGWFDVDNLEKITKSSLRESIHKCSSMVVFLNDETAESEWCLFEWACAAEMGIPVKVIVDMERYSKKAALALLSTAHTHMLEYQLIEFTEKHRRESLVEVSRFLQDCAERRSVAKRNATAEVDGANKMARIPPQVPRVPKGSSRSHAPMLLPCASDNIDLSNHLALRYRIF